MFLSCDWGTTSFRLQLVETRSLKTASSTTAGEGILDTFRAWTATGSPESARLGFYLAILRDRIASLERQAGFSLSGLPLVVSGMASASIGMVNLPYTKMPFAVDGSDLETLNLPASSEFNHSLTVVSGACTEDDMMRGEETLLVGALALHPASGAEDLLVVLPGTHSKHVAIRQGRAVDLVTYMTGEFFALLSQQSILSHSIERAGDLEQAEHRESFVGGVRDGAEGNLLHTCFSIRSHALLKQIPGSSNWYRLSGLLIGAELGALIARKPVAILLVSGARLLPLYETALHALDPVVRVLSCDAGEALLHGQRTVARRTGLLSN
jgi:2-dehydro-3-deoxygalactonokinase